MSKITERERNLFEALRPIVEPLGVRLLDVEIRTHEERPVVRVIISSEDGVGSDTCRRVSENVSPVLELEDFGFAGPYDLEVSSPGVERRLRRPREYELFQGREVEVTCYAPYEDRKTWRGTLEDRTDEALIVNVESNKTVEIPHNLVASVRLYFDAEAALNSGGQPSDER